MTQAQHTRYTLRLGPAAGEAVAVRRAGSEEPGDRRSSAGTPPGADASSHAAAEIADDWSGAAAYVIGPDGQALDYASPQAVALITAIYESQRTGRAVQIRG